MKLHLPTAAGIFIAMLPGQRCTQADDQQLCDSDGDVDTAVISLQLSGVPKPKCKQPHLKAPFPISVPMEFGLA